jgi:hypothetical protein
MKKYLLSTLAAACTLLATSAGADPTKHEMALSCPMINVVSNFDDYLGGYGSELIFGEARPIYFKTLAKPTGIPNQLNSYSSAGTAYNTITGQVTCSYMSSDASNTAFNLIYTIVNGQGGLVTAQTTNVISLQFPIGLSK